MRDGPHDTTPAAGRGPLDGVRVIDLAGESGVFCGRELATLGADVIRVEPPGGDAVRSRSPFLDGVEGVERSLYHFHFNVNKRGVTLDVRQPGGAALLRRLAGAADVLLETAAPGEMDALGVGYEALRVENPALIYTTITPFGQRGPSRDYRGNDLIGVATGGLMYLNGFAEDPPNQPGAEQAYHMASLVAASATLIALVARERDPQRRGRRVDVSLQEAASMATIQTANANLYTWHGQVPRRSGMTGPGGGRSLFRCRDELWVSFVIPIGAPALWQAFVEWVREEGIDATLDGEGWEDPLHRARNVEVVMAAIEQLVARYDRAALFGEGQRRRMLVMPVNDASDLLKDEQLRARGFFVPVEHPELDRSFDYPGVPYRFGMTPARVYRRAPLLGEHNDDVYRGLLGVGEGELGALRERGVV